MSASPLVEQLIEALRCLPGVGQKSAQRMAFHLLQRDRKGAAHLSQVLQAAVDRVGHCQQCRTLTEDRLCHICASSRRDHGKVCIVESPVDVQMIEHAADYDGVYFVLMGHLSPLDGMGPNEIGLDLLAKRLDEGKITEVILATNATVEGEATAHYIADMLHSRNIRVTRIAHGVPLGGELEYVNVTTLSHAFSGRKEV